MADKNKQQLIDLLDRKVFEPILRKSPDDYDTEDERDKLRDVQESTVSERERFREQYDSPERVKDMYHSDLSSSSAKRVHEESRELGLPLLEDVWEEFDQLCEKLGVR
mgnify:CR=1 FL=1